jgi:hypothetical protein
MAAMNEMFAESVCHSPIVVEERGEGTSALSRQGLTVVLIQLEIAST